MLYGRATIVLTNETLRHLFVYFWYLQTSIQFLQQFLQADLKVKDFHMELIIEDIQDCFGWPSKLMLFSVNLS